MDDLTVTAEGFRQTNQVIISRLGLIPPHFLDGLQPELLESMTVMVYFADKYYRSGATRVYDNQETLYSLRTLPPGTVDLPLTETPPLYDLVVAIAVLQDIPPSYLERPDIRERLTDYVYWLD